MIYQNTLAFATQLDEQDSLKGFQSKFLTPKHNGKDVIYLCGNSLGLQPVTAQSEVDQILKNWQERAIEGFFTGDEPWLDFHKRLTYTLSQILGANRDEITIMNSLTVNLHLLMVSFYKPTGNRFKIMMEGGAFPSDQYAIASQARFHGYDPKDAIIELFPRECEFTLRTEDIIRKINEHADDLALVLFSGVNYYTGQLFDMPAITTAAHGAGAFAGFDLAHAAGNVPLQLHEWGVDFATWCSYKYMNSGPGGISGAFVNEKHFNNKKLNRFEGWWGFREDKRFLMPSVFEGEKGAAAWQLSTSPAILLALHKASLDIFEAAGGIAPLRAKSELLTGYLEFLINGINEKHGDELFKVITPGYKADRGCQLSIVCKQNGKPTFDKLTENGVIGDWREPNVIRLSPVPLYNSFKQVFETGLILAAST
ncbi:kynureninase [Mucilaginibacter gotjawali]|uniref:Kynureninase n=2 Tax=Mucilaginibacter gotjawali TaxID=1550579 RepID=A0A839SGU0_9SPHI|nr:kynureninase [Mucilaginibacter gotjawali]MBB3055747.1 kynureninase [Mucilaginibacter gotjawali]BAU54568.1 Kynureninase [Mucilaginibacter gotjawali]